MSFDLLGIFGAGMLTVVTPCVLPLIPIYLSALIGGDIRKASGMRKGQLLFRALVFITGFIGVFTLLGMTASSIGAFLVTHKGLVQLIGGLLILLFGLKFLGVIRISFLDRVVQANDRKLQTRFGVINAFLMGVVFAAGWSPCAGPVLGSVLTYTASTTSDPLVGAGYLATYGLGFGLPLFLVAVFAEAGTRLLKRIGPYLGRVEKFIGILLIVVATTMILDVVQGRMGSTAEEAKTEELVLNEAGIPEPTMVIFTSSQCAVCQRMQDMLAGLTRLCHGKKVLIREFDLAKADNQYLVAKYRLVATPTFVFLDRHGNQAARLVGEQTENTLKQALSALRGTPCPGLELLSTLPEGDSSSIPFPGGDGRPVDAAGGCRTPGPSANPEGQSGEPTEGQSMQKPAGNEEQCATGQRPDGQ
jgi:cytochrome c-type biogenesis protein